MEQQTVNQTKRTGNIPAKWQGMLLRPFDAVVIGVFLVVMLIVGTFLDYPLSASLYDPESGFGLILAAYGQLPSSAGAVLAGTLFLIGRNRDRKPVCIFQCVLGIIMIGVGVYMLCENPIEYMDMNVILSCVIGLLISAGMAALAVFVSINAQREDVILVAVIFLLVILSQMVIINIIKVPWGRPRMRLIMTDDRAFFMPWYQPGTALKDTLTAAGVAAEEFKSFPSGHTGHAVILMLYGLLPWLRSGAGRKDPSGTKQTSLSGTPVIRLFVWIGFGWTVLVAFSRIIMGAHFLSDTAVGAGISFLCVLLIPALVFRIRKADG